MNGNGYSNEEGEARMKTENINQVVAKQMYNV